jgi:hypothetical protein
MPSFESPITSRKFAAQPMRDLNIPDESGYTQPPPQQVRPPQQYGNQMSAQEFQAFQERMNAQSELPENNLAEIEQEMVIARKQKAQGKTPLNEGARNRIEMLLGMTRQTREVKFDENNVYVLRSMTGKEYREAIKAASAFDLTVESPFEVRLQMVARSLFMIAGIPVGQFLGSNTLEARLEFVEELDDVLLNRLFDEYTSLKKECQEKYGLNTIGQVQEVAEDLKK